MKKHSILDELYSHQERERRLTVKDYILYSIGVQNEGEYPWVHPKLDKSILKDMKDCVNSGIDRKVTIERDNGQFIIMSTELN